MMNEKQPDYFSKERLCKHRYLSTIAILACCAFLKPVYALSFNSGSDGSDGALDLSATPAGTTIVFDPATFSPPLDVDGDNVYHFTIITIPENVTVRLGADILGVAPVVWLASGAVQIAGTLDVSGENGHEGAEPHGLQIPAVAGSGGYGGGIGGRSSPNTRGIAGNGPGGGGGGHRATSAGGGGAGHVISGIGGSGTNGGGGSGGSAYGNDFQFPMIGGSGGGGGGLAGGGAGGGAMLIASSTLVNINGTLTAAGGTGGFSVDSNNGGGGGSGGAVRIMAPSINGTGTISAAVGLPGGGRGGSGSVGRIRLEAFQTSFGGSIDPAPVVVTPGLVFPPTSGPSVRVTSIGGVSISASPTGSFTMPDVTLSDAATVILNIEARNIPLGTVVALTLTPETGTTQTVNSTPLAGTLENSTATAELAVPHGFSRFFVQANWVP